MTSADVTQTLKITDAVTASLLGQMNSGLIPIRELRVTLNANQLRFALVTELGSFDFPLVQHSDVDYLVSVLKAGGTVSINPQGLFAQCVVEPV